MSNITLKQLLKNVTNGRKVIAMILKEQTLGQVFNNPTITTLLEYHPTKVTSPLTYTVMRIGEFGSPTLFYKRGDDDEDSISWKTCIENLFEKYSKSKHDLP